MFDLDYLPDGDGQDLSYAELTSLAGPGISVELRLAKASAYFDRKGQPTEGTNIIIRATQAQEDSEHEDDDESENGDDEGPFEEQDEAHDEDQVEDQDNNQDENGDEDEDEMDGFSVTKHRSVQVSPVNKSEKGKGKKVVEKRASKSPPKVVRDGIGLGIIDLTSTESSTARVRPSPKANKRKRPAARKNKISGEKQAEIMRDVFRRIEEDDEKLRRKHRLEDPSSGPRPSKARNKREEAEERWDIYKSDNRSKPVDQGAVAGHLMDAPEVETVITYEEELGRHKGWVEVRPDSAKPNVIVQIRWTSSGAPEFKSYLLVRWRLDEGGLDLDPRNVWHTASKPDPMLIAVNDSMNPTQVN